MPPDCHISYDGILYGVDPQAANRTVMVRPEGEEVGEVFCVYLGEIRVARHQRRAKGLPLSPCPSTPPPSRRTRGAAKQRSRRQGRRPCFDQVSPDEALALEAPLPIPIHPDLDVQMRSLEVYEDLLTATSQEVLT